MWFPPLSSLSPSPPPPPSNNIPSQTSQTSPLPVELFCSRTFLGFPCASSQWRSSPQKVLEILFSTYRQEFVDIKIHLTFILCSKFKMVQPMRFCSKIYCYSVTLYILSKGGRWEMIELNNVHSEKLLDHSASRDEELESKLYKTQDWLWKRQIHWYAWQRRWTIGAPGFQC